MIISLKAITNLRKIASGSKGAIVTVSGGKARTFSTIHSYEIDLYQDIGEFSIHGDKLDSVLSSMDDDDDLRLSIEDNNLTFSNPTTKRRLPSLEVDKSPILDVVKPLWKHTFNNIQDIILSIKKAMSVSGDEKTGRDITFIRIKNKKLSIFTTNGVIFYLDHVSDASAEDILIKLKNEHASILINTVGKDTKALIAVDSVGKIIVKTSEAISVMAGYTEATPDYIGIIDSRFAVKSDMSISENSLEMRISVSKLKESVKRCSAVFSSEADYDRPIKLSGEGSKLELYAISLTTKDSINDIISYSGDRYESTFYSHNLFSALSIADTDSKMYVSRGISQDKQPLCIRSEKTCVYVGPRMNG